MHQSGPLRLAHDPAGVDLQPETRFIKHAPELLLDLSGEEPAYAAHIGERPLYGTRILRLSNQMVWGVDHLHAFLGEDLVLNGQEPAAAAARLEYHIAHGAKDPRMPRLSATSEGYYVEIAQATRTSIRRIEGEVLFATPLEPQNWGTWLIHALPVIDAFVSGGQAGRLMCMCDRGWQQRLLALAGVAPERIVAQELGRPYWLESVAVHAYTRAQTAVTRRSHAQLADFRDRVLRTVSAPAGPERLFLSRRSITARTETEYRVCLDEEALCSAAQALGYHVVEPELLPIERQIALFASAKVVAGLGGAAMFNTVFCRTECAAITFEGGTAFIDDHTTLFASLGLPYAIVLGQPERDRGAFPHHPWRLDVARAAKVLEAFA